jgi:hypothetical protein
MAFQADRPPWVRGTAQSRMILTIAVIAVGDW